ncbi:DeoR/GlpR transcriptional regulator, partial [Serratia ureilytica]|nr:DeoR/GlpR transcriptional regulator [Serratia ureilytica]
MSKLLPNERHQAILDTLRQQGRVLALEMAQRLNTTEATIRRDLRQLAAQNLCKRIY